MSYPENPILMSYHNKSFLFRIRNKKYRLVGLKYAACDKECLCLEKIFTEGVTQT